jgi:general secretion pathway protein F
VTVTWRYSAASRDGKLHRGVLEAADVTTTTGLLLDRGLTPVSIEPVPALRVRTLGARDASTLLGSIGSLLDAGLSLERALATTENLVRPGLRSGLADCRARLTEGMSLSDALDAMPSRLPAGASSLVLAGERSGRLSEALGVAATMLERQAELRGRLAHALAYPVLLAVTGTISIAVIVVVVIPRFAAMLSEVGQSLPPATATLLAMSSWAQRWWWILLGTLVLLTLGISRWVATEAGRRRAHEWLLRMPAVGRVRLGLGAARALHAMGTALKAGVTIVPALRLSAGASSDAALGMRFELAASRVLEGQPVTTSLTQVGAIPIAASQLLAVGEASGRLAEMALRSSDLLASESDRYLGTLVRLVEPLLIVAFGGAVAIVAGILLQAVYSLRPGAM